MTPGALQARPLSVTHVGHFTLKLARPSLAMVAALALFVMASTAAFSQQVNAGGTGGDAPVRIDLTLRTAELVRLPSQAASVLVADPDIVDFQLPSGRSIFVLGKSVGRTTLYALDAEERTIAHLDIVVSHDTAGLEALIAERLPFANVSATSTPSGLVLEGTVPTARDADRVQMLARSFLGPDEEASLISELGVTSSSQVNISVRVAEMDRRVSQAFGFNWNAALNVGDMALGLATGRGVQPGLFDQLLTDAGPAAALAGRYTRSDFDVTGILDALAAEGLVTILAEPNLTAMSGETASFFAGGEFPIPIGRDDNTITIEFRQFGVLLDLVPTVLSPDRISLRVRPEVSELNADSGVVLEDTQIPGLSIRRTETTIELASGQSFALGGLLSTSTTSNVDSIPGLGELPILGALFRSTRYQRNETELVIIATAYVVEPGAPEDFGTPLDGFRPATDVERILSGRLQQPEERPVEPNQGEDPGPDVDSLSPGDVRPGSFSASGAALERLDQLKGGDPDTPRLIGPAGFVY